MPLSTALMLPYDSPLRPSQDEYPDIDWQEREPPPPIPGASQGGTIFQPDPDWIREHLTPVPTPEPEPTPTPFDPWPFPDITTQFPFQPIPQVVPQPAPPQHDWMAEAEKLRQNKEIQDIIAQLQQGLGPMRSTLADLMAMSPEALQQRYQATVETPALRYYQEQTLPSLRRSFVGPGTFWSSMRAGAEQRSGERLNEALMGQRMNMIEEGRAKALQAANLGMQLEQQIFGGRTYPWEMALKAAPMGVQQRGQDLQKQFGDLQMGVQQRGQDLQTQLAELQRRATLEQMKQRERESWGYGESYPGVTAPTTATVSPSGGPIGNPLIPQQTNLTTTLGAAL